MEEFKFPHITESIDQFLNDEEGSIPRNKILMIGSMLIILGVLMADEAFAGHRSHSSHVSSASGYHSNSSGGSAGYSGGGSSSHSSGSNYAYTNSTDNQDLLTNTAQNSNLEAVANNLEGWQLDNIGWWWRNADGTYPVSTWQWIDGNHDGISESYCFNDQGYLYQNTTTPDGYTVNADGAWTVNGVIQTQ